jgi:DNA-binding NarL/FixJ family response regulator
LTLAKQAKAAKRFNPLSQLSPRQRQIVGLLALGWCRKEIASALNLSVKTVEFHIHSPSNRYSVQAKLGFHDPARLTHYALSLGLVGSQSGKA